MLQLQTFVARVLSLQDVFLGKIFYFGERQGINVAPGHKRRAKIVQTEIVPKPNGKMTKHVIKIVYYRPHSLLSDSHVQHLLIFRRKGASGFQLASGPLC